MPLKESVTLDEVLAVLNSALRADPDAMKALVETRIECNEALSNHPTIQAGAYHAPGKFHVGLLGILNGLFGIDEQGWGAIAAHFDVICPDGCAASPTKDLSVGDACPGCGAKLVLGDLVAFKEFNRIT